MFSLATPDLADLGTSDAFTSVRWRPSKPGSQAVPSTTDQGGTPELLCCLPMVFSPFWCALLTVTLHNIQKFPDINQITFWTLTLLVFFFSFEVVKVLSVISSSSVYLIWQNIKKCNGVYKFYMDTLICTYTSLKIYVYVYIRCSNHGAHRLGLGQWAGNCDTSPGSPDPRLQGQSPDPRLQGRSPDPRLQGRSPDPRLQGWSPDLSVQVCQNTYTSMYIR